MFSIENGRKQWFIAASTAAVGAVAAAACSR